MKKIEFMTSGLFIVIIILLFSCSEKSTTEPGNTIPTCIITLPSDNSSFTLGDTVEISVTAADTDGWVTRIRFYVDNQLIYEDVESPFVYLWNTLNESTGQSTIYVEAVDNDNATGTSALIRVILNEPGPPNIPPKCDIIWPLQDAYYAVGDTIQLQVDATDEDGQVSRINFFIDNSLINEDSESPYTFILNTTEYTYGNHQIRAEAIDDNETSSYNSIRVSTNWIYSQPELVGDGWETASLESVGLDSTRLISLMNRLRNSDDHLVHGILIARHNKLVFEEYFDGLTHPTWSETPVTFDRDRLHVSSSVTKSFTSALLGIAIDKGFVSDVESKVSDYYPNLEYMTTGLKRIISVKHLVTMSSGLDWNELFVPLGNSNNDLTWLITLALYTGDDLIDFIFSKNISSKPGTVFLYGGGNTNVIGNIIQLTSGKRLDEFAQQYLFDPLGITENWWWLLRPDFVYCSGDLALRPRDFAKFGQLFLQNGIWNGKRIISEEWVALCATPQFLFNQSLYPQWPGLYGQRGYSFGWWPKTEYYGAGAYAAEGWGGQQIIVMPEYDMVVVLTGGSYYSDPLLTPHQIMVNYILPSIQ